MPDSRLMTMFLLLAVGCGQGGGGGSPSPSSPASTPAAERTPDAGAEEHAALEEEAARYLAVLSSDGEPVEGEMGATAPGGDLDAQIKQVKDGGDRVSVGGGTARGSGRDSGAGAGSGTDAGSGSSTPKGRIQLRDKKAFDDTTLTTEMVAEKIIKAYMTGLKRCYKDALDTDPALRAMLELSFTVDERGRVVALVVEAPTDGLATCVEGRAASWTFAAPKDDDGESTDAAFVLRFQMTPD